jgi:ATP-dependent DNA helicase RecQ
MVMKVARKGRNAGRGFWACTRYPECRGTRDAGGDPEEASASPLASAVRKRVLWTDATTNRPGWTCRYTTAGASLRSVRESREVAEKISQCWIARTEAIPDTTPEVERLAGLLHKILQRGAAPPIDPRSERRLLEMLGLGGQIASAPVPGDLSVRLQRRLDAKQIDEATWWQNPEFEMEPRLVLGSDEEERFIREWLPTRLGTAAARWFIPQAPLEALVAGSGVPAAGQRRLDFLAVRPDGEKLAIEIDGGQHADAELIDDDRDALLASAGVAVTRITVDELRAGMGLGLDEVSRFCAGQNGAAAGDTYARLVWAPVQVHRLALALIEALQNGFLAGDRWVIEVDDPLDVAVELIEPYLDLFLAADRLWAGHAVAGEIVIGTPGGWRRYLVTDEGFTRAELELEPDTADVLVRLEGDRASTDRLEPRVDGPEIVVRSARLPVDVADPVYEGSGRIAARSEGEQVEWALRVMLQSIFAKEEFREGQLDALIEVIEGRDCAVLLPTGAGKSLIYQLAGLILPGRTLVVDPLVALMEDQVEGLRAQGIDRVAAISSFTTAQGQREALLDQVRSGYALFVFVAPERLQQRAFRDALRELSYTNLINLAVVDEAHCVSEWGHDFRPSYLNLGKTLRTICRDSTETAPPILALTGTASRAVLRDVLIELGIERDSERSVVRPRSFDREELKFNIVRAEPANAQSALAGFLRGLPPRFGVPPGDFFSARGDATYSGIVFCPHANGEYGIVDIRSKLASVTGVAPAMYAGKAPKGLENDWERVKRNHAAAFKSNEAPLLVSTKAFGMGIDKANIRYVVHFGIPGSIEGYYQ